MTEGLLFGTMGAESLYRDLVTCYENDVLPPLEDDPQRDLSGVSIEIEVHDTHPPTYHMPSVDRVLEWVVEWANEHGEVDEGWDDQAQAAISHPLSQNSMRHALEVFGHWISYRMANRHLYSVWIEYPTGKIEEPYVWQRPPVGDPSSHPLYSKVVPDAERV